MSKDRKGVWNPYPVGNFFHEYIVK